MFRLTFIFVSILSTMPSSLALSADVVKWEDLELIRGKFYKKNTTVPYSGNVGGAQSGLIKDGRKTGEWTGYYENGSILWEGLYSEGVIKLWVEYHENGEVFAKGPYAGGKKNGEWRIFDNGGKLVAIEIFENGKAVEVRVVK